MNIVLFAFTDQGLEMARRIARLLEEDGERMAVYVPERLAGGACLPIEGGLKDFTGTLFDRDALIFVGACGIAVRAIAPHVASKRSDPAVLCMDERAQFVIPILSGHIGGANRLARRLSALLGATAVLTTATDVNGRFAVDAWAAEHDLVITDMNLMKRVSATILVRDIPFYSDKTDRSLSLPSGLLWGDSGDLGVCVSVRDLKPFDRTLLLAPKALRLGIGCRRGAAEAEIDAAVKHVLTENLLRVEAVKEVATIDIKAGESGLNACCRAHSWPLEVYSADELRRVPGEFTGSEFVERIVGVDNVCERAAAAAGGTILVPKTVVGGVTVAVAELEWGIDFG